MSLVNGTRIKNLVRMQYGKIASREFLEDIDWVVRRRLKMKVGELKPVTLWGSDEVEEHAKFGGKLRDPKCYHCGKRKPKSEIDTGVCKACREAK